MGYDLTMITEPKFQDAPGYWRTGGRGMGMLMDIMTEAGVLDSDSERPEFQEAWPPPGISEGRAEEMLAYLSGSVPPVPPSTEAELHISRQCKAAMDIWKQSRSPLPGKVPAYKFDGNDGWHVVPEECALIAVALEHLLADLPGDLAERVDWDDSEDALIEWIEDWMDYNRVAASHGGYRVC
jgi:hypothetical protein